MERLWCLNEGLPQKGKRWASGSGWASPPASLNEGLPQKGKRWAVRPLAGQRVPASMKGFPRRGSDDQLLAWWHYVNARPQ